MKLNQILASLCIFCISGAATAQDGKTPEEQLLESLAALAPDLPVTAIAESPLPGVYEVVSEGQICLLYTSPSPRDRQKSRMPSSA